jgi:hypothetical protein
MSISLGPARSLRSLGAAAVLGLAVAFPSDAQCIRDGLDGSLCCTPADLRLPAFAAVTQTCQFACLEQCGTRFQHNMLVEIAAPREVNRQGAGVVCGVDLIRMTFKTRTTTPRTLWTVRLRAQYARNWLASVGDPAGPPDTEVWRFLVNGSMAPSSFLLGRFGQNDCAVPPCVSQYPSPHFWGYIDFAQNCSTGAWQAAFALQHDCDMLEHGSTSARPGTFHPVEAYVFVGPSAGFTFDATGVPAALGTMALEDVRRNAWESYPNICTFEESLVQGFLSQVRELCPCSGGTTAPAQYVDTAVSGSGECSTSFQSTGSASNPFLQKRLGHWQLGAGSYPGDQFLLLDEGLLQYIDGCTGRGSLQYLKGVTTIGGFPAVRLNEIPLGSQFVDLGSANRSPSDLSSVVGDKYITAYVLNLNLP